MRTIVTHSKTTDLNMWLYCIFISLLSVHCIFQAYLAKQIVIIHQSLT